MKQHIGFGTSDEWIKAVDPEGTVNVEGYTEFGKGGKYSIRMATSYIMLSQVVGSEFLYLLVPVDRFQTLDTQPMHKPEEHFQRTETAFSCTLQWLDNRGLNYRKALVALPKSLKLIEGAAKYMRYDKDSNEYTRWTPEEILKKEG